jgi:hypothetical protein
VIQHSIDFKSVDSLRYFLNVLDGFYRDQKDAKEQNALRLAFRGDMMPGVTITTERLDVY